MCPPPNSETTRKKPRTLVLRHSIRLWLSTSSVIHAHTCPLSRAFVIASRHAVRRNAGLSHSYPQACGNAVDFASHFRGTHQLSTGYPHTVDIVYPQEIHRLSTAHCPQVIHRFVHMTNATPHVIDTEHHRVSQSITQGHTGARQGGRGERRTEAHRMAQERRASEGASKGRGA